MNKQEKIITMFNDISKTYDIANRILSFGVDKIWRKKACNLAYSLYKQEKIDKILDIACGTGDLMIDWNKIAQKKNIEIKKVIGVDPSVGMLDIAREKIKDAEFIEAGGEDLPIDSNSVDILSISYGIRNIVKRKESIGEFKRVLKPNGLVVILEFTKSDNKKLLSPFSDFYIKKVMPNIGGIISKNKEAYTYLTDSIDSFVTTDELKKELNDIGLTPIYVKGFSVDISTLIIARKPL